MSVVNLTSAQEQEAQRLATILRTKLGDEILQLTRLLVSKPDTDIFGKTECEVRDLVHHMGAKALATVLEERKKRGTQGRA